MSQNEQNKEPQIVKKVRGRPKKAVTEKVKLVEEKSIDKKKMRKIRAKTESVKEKVVKEKDVQSVIKCAVDEGEMRRLIFRRLITQISPI